MWVIHGLYNAKWWDVNDTNCTVNDVKFVLKNVFYVNYTYHRTIDENGSEVRRKFDVRYKIGAFESWAAEKGVKGAADSPIIQMGG